MGVEERIITLSLAILVIHFRGYRGQRELMSLTGISIVTGVRIVASRGDRFALERRLLLHDWWVLAGLSLRCRLLRQVKRIDVYVASAVTSGAI